MGKALSIAVLVFMAAPAMGQMWTEGRHFEVYENPMSDLENTVVEWFWIGSPQCESLEPIMQDWKQDAKPDKVEFIQIPGTFNPVWRKHAEFVYIMQGAGALEDPENREKLYEVTKEDSELGSINKVPKMAEAFGTTEAKVRKAGKSEKTQNLASKNAEITSQYRSEIDGVPFIVVDGKYVINNENVQQEDIPELINHLLSLDKR
jgi:hypothetical protein